MIKIKNRLEGKIFILLFSVIFTHCTPELLNGRVTNVADGDSFTLLTEEETKIKIRLYGIDAPEKGQDFYRVSRTQLSDLIMNRDVSIEPIETDRYGRTVGIVWADNININESMLRGGLAWHYKSYDNNPHWALLEAKAREKNIGIWSMPNPTPPWEWRKEKRKKKPSKKAVQD